MTRHRLFTLSFGWLVLTVALTLALSINSFADEPTVPIKPQTEISPTRNNDCRQCHSCDEPTADVPCLLHPCTRTHSPLTSRPSHDELGPDVVILDEIQNAFAPVPFDHKNHARMAEMTLGCASCHHHTPQDEQHPACKTCHDRSDREVSIDKPGLRGAYHQQCLNCHRDWINERDCSMCHRQTEQTGSGGKVSAAAAKDDLLAIMHPPIPEPEGDVYKGGLCRNTETSVIFRHHEHVQRFGLKCVECHHESSCACCHSQDQEVIQSVSPDIHHKACIGCHKEDMSIAAREAGRCESCHWREGQPKPAPFDHVQAGWPLKKYHQSITCRQCHRTVPFASLDRKCVTCHTGWDAKTFDHSVTGQILDDTHKEIDCQSCHLNNAYDQPPACQECHDADDDGVQFPNKRPGPVIQ
ncbi:MAG: hypothetical protein HJJLKODD_00377 [Phycisphaerae bacterium]|nr:hypothetical protein [Phycisphaerae bacterium]